MAEAGEACGSDGIALVIAIMLGGRLKRFDPEAR